MSGDEELTPAERGRRELEEWRTRELVRAQRRRDLERRVPARIRRLVERMMLGPRR